MDIQPELIVTFITLSFLEIVLGIDNLIFIALAVQNLPVKFSRMARIIGLSLAFLIRVVMLFAITWIMSMTKPVVTIHSLGLSIKDILLIIGGLFLLIKGYGEIRSEFKSASEHRQIQTANNFMGAILQIAFIDFIFSFDSIITAVGLTRHIGIIIAAVAVSMFIMLLASRKLADILHRYPNFKTLGITFIMLIGLVLICEGVHSPLNKNYVYVALLYALLVELLNSFINKKHISA